MVGARFRGRERRVRKAPPAVEGRPETRKQLLQKAAPRALERVPKVRTNPAAKTARAEAPIRSGVRPTLFPQSPPFGSFPGETGKERTGVGRWDQRAACTMESRTPSLASCSSIRQRPRPQNPHVRLSFCVDGKASRASQASPWTNPFFVRSPEERIRLSFCTSQQVRNAREDCSQCTLSTSYAAKNRARKASFAPVCVSNWECRWSENVSISTPTLRPWKRALATLAIAHSLKKPAVSARVRSLPDITRMTVSRRCSCVSCAVLN